MADQHSTRKGRTPWNRGLKGAQTAWNKGLHPNAETRRKQSESCRRVWAEGRGPIRNGGGPKDPIAREAWKAKIGTASKGRKRSPEAIMKQAAALRGRPKSEATRAKISAALMGHLQVPHTPESRAAISAVQRNVWKGKRDPDSRSSYEYKAWRATVLKRDEYTCRRCGKRPPSKTLHAHHVKSFKEHPELRFDVGNGETLCASCHSRETRGLHGIAAKTALARRLIADLEAMGVSIECLVETK